MNNFFYEILNLQVSGIEPTEDKKSPKLEAYHQDMKTSNDQLMPSCNQCHQVKIENAEKWKHSVIKKESSPEIKVKALEESILSCFDCDLCSEKMTCSDETIKEEPRLELF